MIKLSKVRFTHAVSPFDERAQDTHTAVPDHLDIYLDEGFVWLDKSEVYVITGYPISIVSHVKRIPLLDDYPAVVPKEVGESRPAKVVINEEKPTKRKPGRPKGSARATKTPGKSRKIQSK